jgi:hypothetical protein
MWAVDGTGSMRERWAMKLLATIVMVSLLGVLAAAPGAAQSASESMGARDAHAQAQKRAPTRLRVRPLYPYRHYHSLYPLPYDVEYPGPNAHRECVDALVTEHRPSGAVIVPRMRCRWVRGRYAGP